MHVELPPEGGGGLYARGTGGDGDNTGGGGGDHIGTGGGERSHSGSEHAPHSTSHHPFIQSAEHFPNAFCIWEHNIHDVCRRVNLDRRVLGMSAGCRVASVLVSLCWQHAGRSLLQAQQTYFPNVSARCKMSSAKSKAHTCAAASGRADLLCACVV